MTARWILALSLFTCPAASVAQAPAVCLTRGEAESLLLAGMPELLGSIAKRCSATLPAGALLGKGGEALQQSYRDAAREAWPAARTALDKVLRAQGLPTDGMTDESARAFVQLGAAMLAGERLNGSNCAVVNETLELLQPLPPRSVARLLSLIGQAGQDATPQGRASRLRICPTR